jgi:hypothetical protein
LQQILEDDGCLEDFGCPYYGLLMIPMATAEKEYEETMEIISGEYQQYDLPKKLLPRSQLQ